MSLSIGYDSTELDDVDLEALILERRKREHERAEIRALREELARTETCIARAKADGDGYFFDGQGAWGEPPPLIQAWRFTPPTGNAMLPSFEETRARILNRLEALGEHVE